MWWSLLSAQLACMCICVHGCTVLNIITRLQLSHWVFVLAICSLVKMCICHILMIFFLMIKGFYRSLYLFLRLWTIYSFFLLLYFSFRQNKFYLLWKSCECGQKLSRMNSYQWSHGFRPQTKWWFTSVLHAVRNIVKGSWEATRGFHHFGFCAAWAINHF